MKHTILVISLVAAGGALLAPAADAAVALGVTGGTLGIGPEVQVGLTDTLALRAGYAAYSYDRTQHDTNADYFDLGVVFTGEPKVMLTAICNPVVPAATCTQVQQDARTELANLQQNATQLKVWPVVGLGFGYRF